RVRSIKYSNNFSVYYAYDAGGQVRGVTGYYGGTRSDYVKNIQYDEYGSRIKVEYGNGVVSQYRYEEAMHRLVQLKTNRGDSILQNIAYTYDKAGNILTRTENGVVMSNNTVQSIAHRYRYDRLYRLTEAEGVIQENGNTTHSYTNEFSYSTIGNIMKKLQTVKVKGADDPELTYNYTYSYASNKPHAVTNINDNLTYRYDANGNMIAVYDTAKDYNRVLYWDEENRLTKTVDTTGASSMATRYEYDAQGMRIIKDGPYGKSIYIDPGLVISNDAVESNHVFVGNTRVASIVKHKEETNAATYYFASDHLGSSSVLTTNSGSYHERIEYLPYGEVWVEDVSTSSTTVAENGYTTPYKFTGKELDKETNLYYFGARYYDARLSRWISTDPALQEGKYFTKPNDYDTEHDFYWYLSQDGSRKLAGLGGVFNAVNMDVYHYAGQNPVKLVDPDGNTVYGFYAAIGGAGVVGSKIQGAILFDDVNFDVYIVSAVNPTIGLMFEEAGGAFTATSETVEDFLSQDWVTLEFSFFIIGGEVGISNSKNGGVDIFKSLGVGKPSKKIGGMFNFYCPSINYEITSKKVTDKKEVLKILNDLLEEGKGDVDAIEKAIEHWKKKED
ncbi:MAG: RHS repeat-associated core domain-containing protein, partial [Spirochaetota bacterium]